MYKDFSEYWEIKKNMYTKLGVDKGIAYTIWCDAVGLATSIVRAEISSK